MSLSNRIAHETAPSAIVAVSWTAFAPKSGLTRSAPSPTPHEPPNVDQPSTGGDFGGSSKLSPKIICA